jgi:hypothetical protein
MHGLSLALLKITGQCFTHASLYSIDTFGLRARKISLGFVFTCSALTNQDNKLACLSKWGLIQQAAGGSSTPCSSNVIKSSFQFDQQIGHTCHSSKQLTSCHPKRVLVLLPILLWASGAYKTMNPQQRKEDVYLDFGAQGILPCSLLVTHGPGRGCIWYCDIRLGSTRECDMSDSRASVPQGGWGFVPLVAISCCYSDTGVSGGMRSLKVCSGRRMPLREKRFQFHVAACEVCDGIEDSNHFIFTCPFASQVWAAPGVHTATSVVRQLWTVARPTTVQEKHSTCFVLLICWMLCKHRNDVVFSSVQLRAH